MSAATPSKAPMPAGGLRWVVCALLFAAVALSYIDRQVLSVLKPTLAHAYGWSETGYADVVFYFQLTYGLCYLIFGLVVARFGARIGFAIAVTLWTIGHMAQALVTTTRGFAFVRVPLAAGEAGAFPSALAAVAEWFPKRERTLAIGLFNAGSNIGAILAPLLVPAITLAFGWRMAFVLTGLLTVVWLAAWLAFYRRPRENTALSAAELAYIESEPQEEVREAVPLRQVLARRETWAYMAGRFLIDPIWWFFLAWLPDFFDKQYGLDLKSYGPPLVAIYVLADLGSVAGGWSSSALLKRGVSLNVSRKVAMLFCALAVVPVIGAVSAHNLWLAVGLIGLATAGHQGFSANLYALPSDLLPRRIASSVVGLGGLAGAAGGMLMAKYAGFVLQTIGSYTPMFVVAGGAYLTALLAVHLLVPRYRPSALSEST